jgi:hypothetical protein
MREKSDVRVVITDPPLMYSEHRAALKGLELEAVCLGDRTSPTGFLVDGEDIICLLRDDQGCPISSSAAEVIRQLQMRARPRIAFFSTEQATPVPA